MRKHLRRTFWFFLFPSFLGVAVFYIVSFADVARRSFSNATGNSYVGLRNFETIFSNQAFCLAIKNTLRFSLIAIPIMIVLGLVIALILNSSDDTRVIRSLFLFPLAIPTATIVIVWRMFFYRQDLTSLIVSYVWKNLGISIVLFVAALACVSKEVLEAARVDGANAVQLIFYIKIPCIKGSIFTVLVFALFNSFKIYREAYLVAGAYPKQEIYLIQHIFSNWYVNLQIDKLSAASVLLTVLLTIIIIIFASLLDTGKST